MPSGSFTFSAVLFALVPLSVFSFSVLVLASVGIPFMSAPFVVSGVERVMGSLSASLDFFTFRVGSTHTQQS
jgi:hypothetical protein